MIRTSVFAAIFLSCCLMTSRATHSFAASSDVVKIQISSGDTLPWKDYFQGDPYYGFNLAIFGEPLHFTQDMNIRPGYILSWKWDRLRSVYTLKMNRSLKYHDGRPISAFDFEFALIKPLLTHIEGMDGAYLSQIKGMEKVKRGEKFHSGMVPGIKVIDEENIEISPSLSPTRFLYSLNAEVPPLAPIDSFKEDLFEFKGVPIGCGPYKVESIDSKEKKVRIVHAKAGKGPDVVDLYFGGNALQNKVDIAYGPGSIFVDGLWEKKSKDALLWKTGRTPFSRATEILEFNFRVPEVNRLEFRQAVAMVTKKPDKDSMFISGTDQLFPRGTFGYQEDLKPYYNPQKAKELFKSLPKSIREKTYKVIVHGDASDQSFAKNYAEYTDPLQSIGMKIKVVVDGNIEFTQGRSDAVIAIFGRVTNASPLATFAAYLPTKDKPNVRESDQTYVDLFSKAENAESPIEKFNAIKGLTKHIIDQQLVVPIFERYDSYYYAEQRIKAVGIAELTGYIDIEGIETIK